MPDRCLFIIDDHLFTLSNARWILQNVIAKSGRDFQVEAFSNSSEARERWLATGPEVVFLDLDMPEPNGMELLRWWGQMRELQRARVVVSSHMKDKKEAVEKQNVTFWLKTQDTDEMMRRYASVLSALPAYRASFSEHLIRLQVTPGTRTRVDVFGNEGTNNSSNYPLDPETVEGKDEIHNFLHPELKFDSLQRRGFKLYQRIFADPVGETYIQARIAAKTFENLRFRFQTSVSDADTGFELLYDRPYPGQNGEFLALRHPLATQIGGQSPTFAVTNRRGLNELKNKGKKLRFLLVAANLEGSPLPPLDAEAEIDALSAGITGWFRKNGIETEIDAVHSHEAYIEDLQELAQRKQYDVLHFAGHATAGDVRRREPPGLYLWTRNDGNKDERLLNAAQLEGLVGQMNVSFVYLNCCRGGAQRDDLSLRYSRLSGITHAILKAGAAQVLCYRGSVDDSSARSFALTFYENFAKSGEPDAALRATRRRVYEEYELNQTESIWLSAMLFDQSPVNP